MRLSEIILAMLVRTIPSRVRDGNSKILGAIGSYEAGYNYSRFQYERKVRVGLGLAITDLKILDVGTGHGGIATFMAMNGATKVIGIDLNERNLEYARAFSKDTFQRLGIEKPNLEFKMMNAEQLNFDDSTFDLVVCDNLIEHITNAENVLKEIWRVIKPGGRVLIPNFPSIYSKYGPHVKYGIGLPWVNLLFSERTITAVMQTLAMENTQMYEVYPGLKEGGRTFRDIRKYKDLNYITHEKFRMLMAKCGFEIIDFKIHRTLLGKVLSRIPYFDRTVFGDIFSVGTSAVVVKV